MLGWTSAAYKSGPRDRWIGWDEDTRNKRLKFLANNSRFLDFREKSPGGPQPAACRGVLKHLEEVAIPRMPRGIRHQSAAVLTVIVCAVLSGALSYMDMGRWAAGLPQSTLKALGTQRSPKKRRFVPPSEATLRRLLQAVDMASLCQAVTGWFDSQGLKSVALAAVERLFSLRERTHQ